MASSKRFIVAGLGRLPQFAHAASTDDFVFVSGTLGTVGHEGLAHGGIGAETKQALKNIEQILGEAGAGFRDVLKMNVFIADMADFAGMNEAYDGFFPGTPPARITVGGVALAFDARVEIDCIAQRTSAPAAPGRLTKTGFVPYQGDSLYYEIIGEGGIPLVLCHGATTDHASWRPQVSHFAAGRPVVSCDHRGQGRSTDRAGRAGTAAADLIAVLDHLGIAEADFVGESAGGRTVVEVALARPGLVRSLTLTGAAAGFRSGPSETDPDGPQQTPRTEGLRYLPGAVHDKSEAARLVVPVLCLVGDRDSESRRAAARALAGALPDGRLVEIAGTGETPHVDAVSLWNDTVEQFLGSLAG
jgi:2-iminobutanoate/2-iminopropanoate deaminase